jgi:hypothetical protein
LTRDGSVFTLFPDFASRGLSHVALWEAHGCAPLVVHGAALDRARERLRRSGNRRALDNRAARHI